MHLRNISDILAKYLSETGPPADTKEVEFLQDYETFDQNIHTKNQNSQSFDLNIQTSDQNIKKMTKIFKLLTKIAKLLTHKKNSLDLTWTWFLENEITRKRISI